MDNHLENDLFPNLSPELQVTSQLQTHGTKRTRDEMRQGENQSPSDSKRTNQTRGKNWNERDSLLLIEAVTWAEAQKKRIVMFENCPNSSKRVQTICREENGRIF